MARSITPRIAALFSLAAVVGWTLLYLVAAVGHPSYSVTANFLSDLGDTVTSPNAWAFNLACVLAGTLALPFAWVLGSVAGGRGGRIARITLVVAAIFLIGVGAFPERSPYSLHTISASGFFLALTASQGALIVPMWTSPPFRTAGGVATASAFAVSVVMIATGVPPLAEHVGVFVALAWFAFASARLWRASVRAAADMARAA